MTLSPSYAQVTEPTPAFLLVGHVPGNTYAGASRAYDPVYREVALQPGDEVHNLPGGVFLVRDGTSLGELRWRLPEKHLFERGGVERNDPPASSLAPLSAPSRPVNGYRDTDVATLDASEVHARARAHGRGPVWVLPA